MRYLVLVLSLMSVLSVYVSTATTVDLSAGAVSSTNIVNTPNHVLIGMGYKTNLLSYVTVSGISTNVVVAYLSSMDGTSFVTENAYTVTSNGTVKHSFTGIGRWAKAMFLSKAAGTPTVRFLLRAYQ